MSEVYIECGIAGLGWLVFGGWRTRWVPEAGPGLRATMSIYCTEEGYLPLAYRLIYTGSWTNNICASEMLDCDFEHPV